MRPRKLIVGLAVTLLALSACGDGNGDDAPSTHALGEPPAGESNDSKEASPTPLLEDPGTAESECIRTGCSGQVCAAEPVVTTCEWLEEYGCYWFARCERQPGGGCGWTATEEQARCLANLSRPPTQTPKPTPTPDRPGVPNNRVEFPGCEGITAESHYCLTLSGGQIGLLGLDSGATCNVATTDLPAPNLPFGGSIAWQNEHVYVCGKGVVRISIRDGSWEAGGRPCMGVASYRGGLLVNRWLVDTFDPADPEGHFALAPPMSWYSDYQAFLDNQPGQTFDLGRGAFTMTAQGERLYTAWHAGKSVYVDDLSGDERLGVLTLEDYLGYMLGMSVTEDGYLVLSGDPWGQTVYVFDAYDGRQLKQISPGVRLHGLACAANASLTPRDTPTPTPTPPAGGPTATPCYPRILGCADPCTGLESDPRPFRLHELPPSTPIEMNCLGGGAGSSNYALSEELLTHGATEELHVIGVYEGRGNPGFRPYPQGVVDVVVRERPKPVVLALSSHESTLWRIKLEPGAALSRVILQGHYPQEVEGVPEGVPVQRRGAAETCGLAYGWEVAHGGGREFELMMASLRRLTGLVETSFQGCYAGNRFEIPYWSGEPPVATRTPLALNEDMAREEIEFPGCEVVTQEQHYCLTTTYGGVGVVGLESGTVCPLRVATSLAPGPDVASIAWRGEAMYVCSWGQGLVRVSLVDGAMEIPQVPCGAITNDGDKPLLYTVLLTEAPTGNLFAYPSYAAILSGEAVAVYNLHNSRMTAHNGRLYSAWHSTETIDVLDLATNQQLPSITLEGYDGWILGLAVVGDGELVVSGDPWGETIHIFDVATGAKRRELRPSMPVFGFSCVSRS